MKLRALIQRLHLWAGLVLGVQVLLWMASGVVMSFLPLDLVRGETHIYSAPPKPLEPATYASPGGVLAQHGAGVTSVELTTFLGQPVYIARGDDRVEMYNAATAERMSPISERMARKAAEQDYLGEGEIIRADLISFPPQEYSGERPVWRVDFNDRLNTRIYVSPATGEINSRRNDAWRFFDFFWMLHIMDYKERENFNSWWLRLFASAGFVFALSGIVMVGYRLKQGRYGNDLRAVAKSSKTSNGTGKHDA